MILRVVLVLSLFIYSLKAVEYADVVSVKTSGSNGAYRFSVSVKSPDISCKQYANWWEVLSEDGNLLYRRILWHSHPAEQPVTRSGIVSIKNDQLVYVRAHLNNRGYGGDIYKGSVLEGFKKTRDKNFHASIESQKPQATECWY